MDKVREEFIARKEERKNSAYAKLKLLIYGVKDAPDIFKLYEKELQEHWWMWD